jgi:predicted GNAT family N-acyltransferase
VVTLMPAHEKLSDVQFESTYRNQYASAKVTPRGYLYNMATRTEQRGKGHGRALMNEITAHADALGKPLSLNAREELHPWYGSHGFKVAPDRSDIETAIMGTPLLVRQPKRR